MRTTVADILPMFLLPGLTLGHGAHHWPSGYADERQLYSGQTPRDQTDFTIAIPEDLGGAVCRARCLV
ncbi:hypothetical protein DL766_004583 [Monosporascus sp. MC13-8B]|uniref:Uncharacterized protein n=1 Tax=Monosporascus cannonballus TaxID=155416 RepID=A0ABY0H5G4_9PEZI|nr:hypothetical protein DL762_006755 [Monosporascus cannonballus]RYO85123.1 hypothetical protein DL763_007227 [Monosporascus cannonballus]RYP31063.1 hypothetical protein DL766_004583 [Monosporascus sp. MC13-8B]